MEYKYTSDGKKVVVVGNLNSKETIVQEVFVSNDIEIPSGENFVVKSLHDAPVVSWQEKRAKELEARKDRIEQDIELLEGELRAKRKRVREIGDTLTTQINWMKSFVKNISEESFKRLELFVSGKVTHLVLTKYDLEIKTFDEFMANEYGMKLISMFGKDDGSMTFGVSSYSDGSGGYNNHTVIPATSYGEALAVLQDAFNKSIETRRAVNSYDIKTAERYGLHIPKDILEAYYNKQIEEINTSIKNSSVAIEKLEAKKDELKKKINNP